MSTVRKATHAGWAIIGVLLLTCGGLGSVLYRQVNDPADLYTDQGASGPFEWAREKGPAVEQGPFLREVHPGQSFGVVSVFCPDRDASLISTVRFIRVDDGEQIGPTRRRAWRVGERPCGPAVATLTMPIESTPGEYRLERVVVMQARGRVPQTVVLDPLPIMVGAAP